MSIRKMSGTAERLSHTPGLSRCYISFGLNSQKLFDILDDEWRVATMHTERNKYCTVASSSSSSSCRAKSYPSSSAASTACLLHDCMLAFVLHCCTVNCVAQRSKFSWFDPREFVRGTLSLAANSTYTALASAVVLANRFAVVVEPASRLTKFSKWPRSQTCCAEIASLRIRGSYIFKW